MKVIDFDFKKNEDVLSVFMDNIHSDLEHIFEHKLFKDRKNFQSIYRQIKLALYTIHECKTNDACVSLDTICESMDFIDKSIKDLFYDRIIRENICEFGCEIDNIFIKIRTFKNFCRVNSKEK